MAIKYLENLLTERDSLASQVMALAELASNENRSLTDAENSSVTSMRTRIEGLDTEVRQWSATTEAFSKFASITAKGNEGRAAEKRTTALTAGEQFVESRAFGDYSGRGTTERVEIETRALMTDTWETQPQEVAGVMPLTNLTLWNTISKISVSDGSITYPVWEQGSDAAIVPEGTLKPEQSIDFEMVEKVLPTVAHGYFFSRQFAADKATIRTVIDGELRNGVARKLNSEAALAINGVTTPSAEADSLLKAIRLAQSYVEDRDGNADLLLVHPADAADLDITLLGSTLNGAAYGSPVWGLRVVRTSKITAGRPLVLDSSAVVAYVRSGIEYFLTDSDVMPDGSSAFRRNILSAIAEARALTVVQRPYLVVPAEVA